MTRHPDEHIDPKFIEQMNQVARLIDEWLNGGKTGKAGENCFVLLLAPFDTEHRDGRVNYISNGNRSDIVTLMKETIARFEGQPEMSGR